MAIDLNDVGQQPDEEPAAPSPAIDFITIMTDKWRGRATKQIRWNTELGQPDILSYDKMKTFIGEEVPVSSIYELADVLGAIEREFSTFIVRGKIADGADHDQMLRRVRDRHDGVEPTLLPAEHHWVALDLDAIPCPENIEPEHEPKAAVEYVIGQLPKEFHDVTCRWQFTSSQGLKGNKISLRLYFWSDRPLSDGDLKAWLCQCEPGTKIRRWAMVDGAVFSPAQPIYTASPIILGMQDPVLERTGILIGDRDEVMAPEITRPQRPAGNGSALQPGEPGGQGYDGYCARIGDHEGGHGFHDPIKSAIASFIGRHGSQVDTSWLRADLERVIRQAPRDRAKHPDAYIETRVADLDPLIASIVDMQRVSEEADRNSSQGQEQEILPPVPAASVADIRAAADNLFPKSEYSEISNVIRQIAIARLSSIEEEQILNIIKSRTNLKIDILRNALKDAKRELGIFTKTVASERKSYWFSKLECYESGDPKPILMNIAIALREDPAWRDVLAFNEFTGWITLLRPPPWADKATFQERPWNDADGRQATIWIQKAGIHADSKVVFEAVTTVAEERPYHPVRGYLDNVVWDGIPRLDDWLHTYLGADPASIDEKGLSDEDKKKEYERFTAESLYLKAIGAKWMIGAVRRIYNPGEKVDCALVLIGPQGILKSTVFSVLGGEWFTDQVPDLKSKDAAIQLAGVWIVEFAEFLSIRSAEINHCKGWMSICKDRYRAPYGRQPSDHPRQSVFGGTTNDQEFLHDPTGARRFWSALCGAKIDIEALRRDRDQLWAEAVHRYRLSEPHWLDTDELNSAAAAEAENHYVQDPWEQVIRDWLVENNKEETFTTEILTKALGRLKSEMKKDDEMRVATCLRRLGWTKGKQIWSGPDRGKRPFEAPEGWVKGDGTKVQRTEVQQPWAPAR